MQSKWYLSTLIVILTFLGFSQEHIDVPNQEIVVQFTDEEVSLDAAQNAIAIVKKQLAAIGVDKIHVHESIDGRLTISYYSEIDIAGVQEIFSIKEKLAFDYTSFNQGQEPLKFPSEENTQGYKLNITEIQQHIDAESDFDGILAKLLPDHDRSINTKVFYAQSVCDTQVKTSSDKIAFTKQRKIALAIDTQSHNIPEVRAGPISGGLI